MDKQRVSNGVVVHCDVQSPSTRAATLEAKLIVLGAQGVGKTSILAQQSGDYVRVRIRPTIATQFAEIKVPVAGVSDAAGTAVKLLCWDTAGQERFRSITRSYYRNCAAALLVFDITERQSFLQLQHCLAELHKVLDDEQQRSLVVCVVGNKVDMLLYRKVQRWEAEFYTHSIGAHYFETSAFRNLGVADLFEHIARRVLENGLAKTEQELAVSNERLLLGNRGKALPCCF